MIMCIFVVQTIFIRSQTKTLVIYTPCTHAPPMHHAMHHPCTNQCTAQFARHPQPHFNPTQHIRNGTRWYWCYGHQPDFQKTAKFLHFSVWLRLVQKNRNNISLVPWITYLCLTFFRKRKICWSWKIVLIANNATSRP